MTVREIDTLINEELDRAAASAGYIDEARALLEDAFANPSLPSRRRRFWPLAAATVGGLAAAAAAVLMLARSDTLAATTGPDGELLPVGSWVSSTLTEERRISFSDGSSVNLAENTEVRLQHLKEEGAHLLLERGSVSLSVVHRNDTDWHLDAGPFRVLVTGTQFGVDWVPETKSFGVEVTDGTVVVQGPMLADGKPLSTGERMQVSLLDGTAEIYTRDTYERIVSGDGADTEPSEGELVERVERTESETPEVAHNDENTIDFSPHRKRGARASLKSSGTAGAWSELARKGSWVEAVAAAEKFGFKSILSSASAQELMLLGDASRLAGRYPRAVQAYMSVRERFTGTSQAQRAAFTLGRIEFDTRGNYKAAARWFRTCLADNVRGSMAMEASGRLLEALDKAGDRRGARAAAKQYLSSYRNGPHSDLARQVLSNTSESL